MGFLCHIILYLGDSELYHDAPVVLTPTDPPTLILLSGCNKNRVKYLHVKFAVLNSCIT